MSRQVLGLLGWLLVCFAAAAVGGLASVNAGDSYGKLIRPDWAPPGWLFGPVWSVLYVLMGIAAWLVWKRAGFNGAGLALSLFVVQLVLNGLWSYLFFGRYRPDLAFLDIVVLWSVIVVLTVLFWRVHRGAGAMLVPYLVWVSFASYLNFVLWRMNVGGKLLG